MLNVAAGYREVLASGIEAVNKRDHQAQEAAAIAENVVQEIGLDYSDHKETGPLKGTANSARTTTRAEFAKLRTLMDAREEELLRMIDQEQLTRLSPLEEHNHQIGLYRSQLSTTVYRATVACNATDTGLCAQLQCHDCLKMLDTYRSPKQWQICETSQLPMQFNNIAEFVSAHGGMCAEPKQLSYSEYLEAFKTTTALGYRDKSSFDSRVDNFNFVSNSSGRIVSNHGLRWTGCDVHGTVYPRDPALADKVLGTIDEKKSARVYGSPVKGIDGRLYLKVPHDFYLPMKSKEGI